VPITLFLWGRFVKEDVPNTGGESEGAKLGGWKRRKGGEKKEEHGSTRPASYQFLSELQYTGT